MQGARCSWRELVDSLLNTELKAVAHNLEIRVSTGARRLVVVRLSCAVNGCFHPDADIVSFTFRELDVSVRSIEF